MDLITAVKATYEVVGQEISDLAIQAIVTELKQHDLQHVLVALTRCRKELRRITLADILDRVPGGHPGAEEAWSIVSPCLMNEDMSVVWTGEMAEAFGVARRLSDDPVAARLAFKEAYTALTQKARAGNARPQWRVSLGYDACQRASAIQEAVEKGRLSLEMAQKYLPNLTLPDSLRLPAMRSIA